MSVALATAAIQLATKFTPEIIGLFSKDKGKKAEEVISVVNSVAESLTGKTGDEAFNALSSDPALALEFKRTVLADSHVSEQMRYADIANARAMQIAALSQDDVFSKRFPYYFGSAWSLFSFIYITCVTFFPITPGSEQIVYTILGFLLGTALSSVFQYLFGSTVGSKEKTEILKRVM